MTKEEWLLKFFDDLAESYHDDQPRKLATVSDDDFASVGL